MFDKLSSPPEGVIEGFYLGLGSELVRIVSLFAALVALPAFAEFLAFVEASALGKLTSLVSSWAGTSLVD